VPRVHLVTQAYGRDDIRAQALYAAWSALAWARLKPLMIRDLVRRFPGEKVLYVDADVLFTRPARELFDRIGPGRGVLHVREYDIATHPTKQLRRFRRRMRRVTFRGRPVALDHAMWNAGAVGLDPSHLPLVDEWIAMVDEIYPQWPYWIHEQYAVCQLLQRAGTVSPAADVVLHYWDRKEAAVAAIAGELPLLRAGPPAAAHAHLRAHPLALPPPGKRKSTLGERLLRIVRRYWPPRPGSAGGGVSPG
jgi:hypothetical protein